MKLPLSDQQRKPFIGCVLLIAFGILFAALVFRFEKIWAVIEQLFSLSSPFLIGFAIAFLLGPVQRKIEWAFRSTIFRTFKRDKLMHGISALLSLGLLVAVCMLFLQILVPKLIQSIKTIIPVINDFFESHSNDINDILRRYEFISGDGDEFSVIWENVVTSQLKNITMLLDNLVVISRVIFNSIYALLIGLITAFYILLDKDHLAAQIKKIGYSLMPRERIEQLIFWTREANRIFAGFIAGKILDSFIIGVICYLGMLIFKIKYALLISVVIGVTNLIPFFGPFIGGIPSILLLLLVEPDPRIALWFAIYVLVLQQLDGNVIGPHILGDSVGVSALSIMIAIVIGSGMFGFVGMLISVPVYALGYAFVRALVTTRLKKRGLPTDTNDYIRAPEELAQNSKEHQ